MDSSFPNSPFQDNTYAYPYPHFLHAQFANHPTSPSILERAEEGGSWMREEWVNHEMDGKASKIRSKGIARENEQRSAKTTEKEAKRELLRQKRDSVREWLKQQESVPGPSFEETLRYSSPQDCADTSEVFTPERSQLKVSDERREKMERFEREIERKRDQPRKITFVQPLTPKHRGRFSDPIEIDSSVLDIRNEAGSDANVTSPTPLHPEASKHDIFNALVGVMKRVEDLESQLDFAASNVHKSTGSGIDDAINDNRQSVSYNRKSQERSSLLDEYYSGIPENVHDEDGEMMIQQAENGKEAETESDPSLPVGLAESRGDEQARNQETQWDLKEEMATLSDLKEAVSKIQNRKSLAEEMRSADHARLRMSTQNGGQTEEEDEGVLVLVEGDGDGDDIEIVHVDSGSEGAFEVVELDEEEKGSTHGDHASVLSSVYSII